MLFKHNNSHGVKLYRLSDNIDNLYVLTSYTEPDKIRSFYKINDHCGMDYEKFKKIATIGKLEELTSISQVNESDLEVFPYCTDEWIESLNDYLLTDQSILDYWI